MTPPHLTSSLLSDAAHGFFGRQGGASAGDYQSLNCGPGSDDVPGHVAENRQRAAAALGADHLFTAYQTHSAEAAFIEEMPGSEVRADALVTARPGLAIGVLAADCVPVLFAEDGLVGAAHAGWRGSLGGILEATVDLMTRHGAGHDRIRAVIGPSLRAPAFEVGDDLIGEVTGKYPEAERFFSPGGRPGKSVYDHAGFVRWRLIEAGLAPGNIDDTGGCTLSHPDRWFSYRASRAKGQADYGRNLSLIALPKG